MVWVPWIGTTTGGSASAVSGPVVSCGVPGSVLDLCFG